MFSKDNQIKKAITVVVMTLFFLATGKSKASAELVMQQYLLFYQEQ